MTPIVQNVTTFVSFGTVIVQVIIFLLICSVLIYKNNSEKKRNMLIAWTSKYILELGLLVSLGSVFGSLFYSNIAGFEPCEFCWWQRIMLYPQVIIFAVALYYKRKYGTVDRVATSTSLILSIVGAGVALFQYYGQMFDPSLLSACVANGPSCAKLYFVSFNYITIPMLSFTTCILLITLILVHKRVAKLSL